MNSSIAHAAVVGLCVCGLLPAVCQACKSNDRRACEKQIVDLVTYRSEAIEHAFGDLSGALPAQMKIRFVSAKDVDHPMPTGGIAYDAEERTLLMSRVVADQMVPNPLRYALDYWPYYENDKAHELYPVVEAIDDVLWTAYLQEAAKAQGASWPHENCHSVEVDKRLPCEMVTAAIGHFVKTHRTPIFNENRLDRIWPENLEAFAKRNWRYEDADYREVQRYGGLMLVKPLITEFGVPRTFAYLAQTPFQVEDNNIRLSARRYQDRAREALRVKSADSTPVAHESSVPRFEWQDTGQLPARKVGTW